MNETRIFADAYETTFADPGELLEFLAERGKTSSWIRKPTRMLRLVPISEEAERMGSSAGTDWEEILKDTEDQGRSVPGEELCNQHDPQTCRNIRQRASEAGNRKLRKGSQLLPEGCKRRRPD